MPKLNLDRDQIDRCRELADSIVRPVERYINMHSTVSIERAVLRLLGFNSEFEVAPGRKWPIANLIVDRIPRTLLKNGVGAVMAALKKRHPNMEPQELGEWILRDADPFANLEECYGDRAMNILRPWVDLAYRHLDRVRYRRDEMRGQGSAPNSTAKAAIVGTGNLSEDLLHAKNAAELGADVIFVQRSTAQSLLDYVPQGETSEGFGGTFATRENFRLMREALNEISREQNRYIKLAHSSAGLCMPELSALAAMEGVDLLENDSLYGVLYRDINMKRTLIDQHFSREILARGGMVALTGEANLLQNADMNTAHYLVLASHFLNEHLAKVSGMRDDLIGLTHAFEIDPDMDDSFVQELAMAQLVRDVFPRAPLNYMPPTRHRQGDASFNLALDALACLCSSMTGQAYQVLSLGSVFRERDVFQERLYTIKNASYVFNATRSLFDEVSYNVNGKVMRRARSVLDLTSRFLAKVRDTGLLESLEQGLFLDVPRLRDGGRGFDGVFEKSRRYFNPFFSQFKGN